MAIKIALILWLFLFIYLLLLLLLLILSVVLHCTNSCSPSLSSSSTLRQELQGLHAHEVHPVGRRPLRAGGEQPPLLHHPRGHPLLHYTQAAHQRCRAHVPAVPRHRADPLTPRPNTLTPPCWCYWTRYLLDLDNVFLHLPLAVTPHTLPLSPNHSDGSKHTDSFRLLVLAG